MKKVVIIDDESPARSLLKEYLEDYPSLIVIGEANNGIDAIKIIEEFKPDLVFLDIQMPGMTGFEVLKNLNFLPKIIFSTAYDQYALSAFEVNAIDYLLKPYTKQRFGVAIDRIMSQEANNATQLKQLAAHLLQEQKVTSYPASILVQDKKMLVTLQVDKIIWISAAKDYSELITGSKKYLSNFGISQIAEKLNPENFIRVHRSSIINLKYVEAVFKHPSSYDVKMKNGDVVKVSRSYLENIKKLTF